MGTSSLAISESSVVAVIAVATATAGELTT
jgi:hypothetical protein